MASFIIRVELHDADSADYYKLAKLLAAKKITDIIMASNGAFYRLPPAEYSYEGEKTRADLLKIVQEVAAQVVRSYAVLVTESIGSTWSGLEKLTQTANA